MIKPGQVGDLVFRDGVWKTRTRAGKCVGGNCLQLLRRWLSEESCLLKRGNERTVCEFLAKQDVSLTKGKPLLILEFNICYFDTSFGMKNDSIWLG